MTDLQQTASRPISVNKAAVTLLVTTIFGAIVGFAAWSLQLSTSQAIAIVSIGRFDQTQYSFIEEPQTVIERIRSPNFVAAASARSGIPELSTLLPAGQYGGSRALSARSLRDPSLVEIKVILQQPELALKATTAIVDELIADHEARTAPLIQNLQSAMAVLNRHQSEMIEASETIAKRASGSSQTEGSGQDNVALLSARALTESGLAALIKNESDLRTLLSNVRKSQIVAVPTVTTPKAASLYRIVAAGMVVGLLVGLLLLQMFPGFFRRGGHPPASSQPNPT
jgi:hypothetical protein